MFDLFEYWVDHPPEHELGRMFATAFTTWRPKSALIINEEEHRKSLEQRWASGEAMSPKQLYEAMGGSISLKGTRGGKHVGKNLPGIGPFPGA